MGSQRRVAVEVTGSDLSFKNVTLAAGRKLTRKAKSGCRKATPARGVAAELHLRDILEGKTMGHKD